MNWQFDEAHRPLLEESYVLRLTNFINSGGTINNSAFYNFGNNDFSIGTGFMIVQNTPVNGQQFSVDIIGKRQNAEVKSLIANVATGPSLPNRVLGTISGSATEGVSIYSSVTTQEGQWTDTVFLRNGGAAGNNNLANYHLYVNGALSDGTKNKAGTGVPNATNTGPFTFSGGENQGAFYLRLPMYIDYGFAYNRALTLDEIEGIAEVRRFPGNGVRGIWEMNAKSGLAIVDSSSVKQNGTINGYSGTDVGSGDPNTNRVWLPKLGILWLPVGATSKVFTAHKLLTIKKIARFNSTNLVASYTHTRGGTTLASGNLAFDGASLYTFPTALTMQKGDLLTFTISGHTTPCTLELFY